MEFIRMLSYAELLLGILAKQNVADPATLILRSEDDSASGSSDTFLKTRLKYITDKHRQKICVVVVDGEEVGVMMGWEEPIMRQTVEKLRQSHPNASNLSVLNVGFGLGIVSQSILLSCSHFSYILFRKIDTLFQDCQPPP